MTTCQNTLAARHAFPSAAAPVADRSMTLTIPCREPAGFTAAITGLGTGRARTGASIVSFSLCENHAELYQQIDRELVQDGWAPSQTGRPVAIAASR